MTVANDAPSHQNRSHLPQAMIDEVVELSLCEFTDKLLPTPRRLFLAQFLTSKMAGITEAFTDMIKNYKDRAWDNDRYYHPEDQLADEFMQIVNGGHSKNDVR
ncbi:hypothetical protein LXA43DRAFT_1122891 [Ganoderma leucocontextum]|nr:hypothetical protein LXA43DRAFT_1122891 [Ganoderma leucocontextum]